MNNIQKNFKNKSCRGIRAFSSGGLLDDFNARMKGLEESAASGGGFNSLPDTPSVASAMAEGQRNFDAGMGAPYGGVAPQAAAPAPAPQPVAPAPQPQRTAQPAPEPSPSNRVRTPGRTSVMPSTGIAPDWRPRSNTVQFGQRAFAGGGTVDPVEQLLSQMKNKYGGVAPQAAAPAPAPQPVAPAPQPQRTAQPAPTIQGAVNSLRSHAAQLKEAAAYAHGGEIEPFVDGAGFIRGTPGIDKVPAQVAQTGENILVGDGERIVNQKQNKALEHLAQKTTGQPLDDYLEGATGQPVGPKVKKGIRAAEFGAETDDLTRRAELPRTAPVAGGNSSPEAAALRERLASSEGNSIRSQMAQQATANATTPRAAVDVRMSPVSAVNPMPQEQFANAAASVKARQPAAATPAAVADMLPPDSVTPTAKPAAPDTMLGKAKAAISSAGETVADKVRSIRGTPAPAASPAEQLGRTVGQQVGAVRNAPKVLGTNGGSRLAGVDFALRSGQTWDVTGGWDDTAEGGIGPMDKGQIIARNALGTVGDVVGGAAGVGLGGLARLVGPVSGVAGKAIGGLAGAVTGGNLADTGMGYLRRMINAANGALGGDPNYWKDSDELIDKQTAFLRAQPGYEESDIQKGSKRVSDALDKTVGAALEKVGIIDRGNRGAAPQSAEEKRIRAANAEVLAGKQKAVDQSAIDALKKAKVADNPNVRSLRAAGVTGDVGGDDFEWKKDAVGRYSPTTGKTGIRSIDTSNGKVFAGRDAKGQLNVVSNLDQSAADGEAARAKEAARINADLKRQTETFDKMAIERDMKSNNPADRASAQQRMGLRQLDAQIAQANQANETTRRGQDMVLQGHQMDNQTKLATLKNQMLQQNLERNTKLIDDLYGGATLKTKDGEMPNEARRDFVNRLSKTLGQHGRTIGHLSPKDMVDFQIAYDMDKDGKNGSFMKFYNNWIAGAPEVEDFDPFRSTARATGERGKSNDWGFYETRNGSLRREGPTVGKEFLSGTYDINRKQLLDR